MYVLVGFSRDSSRYFHQNSLFCNVRVSIVQNVFSNAILTLAKSFVHIHLNPSRVPNGLPLQYIKLGIMGPKVDGS